MYTDTARLVQALEQNWHIPAKQVDHIVLIEEVLAIICVYLLTQTTSKTPSVQNSGIIAGTEYEQTSNIVANSADSNCLHVTS